MDMASDEPPTSAVLLDSCHFSQVVFNDVEKFYVPGGDVTCRYSLTQNMAPRGKDWVGIFRVGWKTTREYYTFMWAPLPSDTHGAAAAQHQIQFKAYYLPKDDEYYQFCYVDQDGVVRGASVPFQFRAETEDDILVVTRQGEVEELELQNKNVREENEELKANCARLQQQNVDLQEELKKTQELHNDVESLRSNIEKLELELNSLKKENKHLKERDDCRGTELHQLKEQIQNVSSDKERLASSLRAALEHLDQLQSQVLNYEKEVENLSRMNRDKAEQLASLKEENRRLRVSRTPENPKAEKDALPRRLPRAGEDSSSCAVPQAPLPAPEAVLVFGNPYRAAGANLGAEAADAASPWQCPMCSEVFPEDTETSQLEAHVQSHLLQCPRCSQTFDSSSKQVFDDHVLCHGLE